MKFNNKSMFSLAMMVAVCFSTISFGFAPIDEGMFAPGQIAGLNLKRKGLKIKPEEIYNPAGGGLTEAVVHLTINGRGGCTSEFVSPDGLILTNHHCGFGALVSASTPANDLVETGFNAGSRTGEIEAKNYGVRITERVEDVTAKIRTGTENLTGEALAAAYKKNVEDLTAAEKAKAPAGSMVRIQMLNDGYFFYLYQTRDFNDIRMVYAPPRNIGVFGGDPDNFEWTRHTGDFTFLRAYTAPDGTAAAYSPSNIPYKPRKFLTMNIGGLKENDFVFVMGYPGGTTRYRESWSIKHARDARFPFDSSYLGALSASLNKIGSTDEEKRIKFQDQIASYDNYYKAWGGGAIRLTRAQVVQQQQAEEARLATWIAADAGRQTRYGNMLTELKAISEETNATSNRDAIIQRLPDGSTVVFKQVYDVVDVTQLQNKTLTDAEIAVKLKEIQAAYATREPAHEFEMLKFYLKSFDELPADQKFAPAEKLFGSLKGKDRRDAEAKFAASIATGEFATPARVTRLYGPRTMEFNKEREDILGFARGVAEERAARALRAVKYNAAVPMRLRPLYMRALTEMNGGVIYPDANSTLRFSYGNIVGYAPREAEYRTPFTTMKGMIEKNTGEKPFDAPQKLIDLQNAQDFGRYGENGSVGVNFISTTDIIGGNSGSPILNAKGEQIGLCFDGNYEGLGNDYYYDYNTNRTISVDIRYVLFVTEKFGNAKWVVDEMKIVGKR